MQIAGKLPDTRNPSHSCPCRPQTTGPLLWHLTDLLEFFFLFHNKALSPLTVLWQQKTSSETDGWQITVDDGDSEMQMRKVFQKIEPLQSYQRSKMRDTASNDGLRCQIRLVPSSAQAEKEDQQVMAISSSHSFLIGQPLLAIHKHHHKKTRHRCLLLPFRASASTNKKEDTVFHFPVEKLAVVCVAAGVLILGAVGDAEAAKSGGRIGGQAFRSSAPRPSGPRINNNSRTNIFINPPVAPPLIGGYGYGVPFYGGWGWSPFTFFSPGPGIAVGIGGGFEVFAAILLFGAITTVIRRLTARRDEDEDA
ncbi:hypothetical protein HPP92_017140 [Vanilla planifolia]|uniref:Uncharacterized protein n=1 Tax=Vanilla planifolia TaxID=51239 RepID=A0A835URY2_VANPL|nr:hypothetical protein HPP92_017140 [Vanilla planifolia]